MIDSHCPLDHEPLFSNLNQVLLRSKEIGIEKILTICTTKESFKNILNIVKNNTMIFGTFGFPKNFILHDFGGRFLFGLDIFRSQRVTIL